jgi:hypothetical protein
MKLAVFAISAVASAGLGLAACSTVTQSAAPAPSPASSSRPSAPTAPPTQAPAAPASPAAAPNVTDPWAVVSAYYGDIESGDYSQAWALLNAGATTGQTYQQFVDGFTCTGAQQLTEVGESGDQVTFDLAATDTCTGQVQHYAGTDTVQDGKIVAANVQHSG